MTKEKKGVIYILTNPSFEEYVKIGYADDIDTRLAQLNRSECTPFAFRVYATYEVDNRLTDMKIHAMIDKLNPNLRAIDNVNGKKRVREFYAMTAEDAYGIFEAMAEIHGTTDRLKLIKPSVEQEQEALVASEIAEEVSEKTAKRWSNRLEFWTMFNDLIDKRGKPFNKHKATKDHWYTVAIGSSQCYISIDLINKENRIRVGLWISDNKDLFDELYMQKAQVESSIPFELVWDRLDSKKASVVCTYIPDFDFEHKDNYDQLMNKIIDYVIEFKRVFSKLI